MRVALNGFQRLVTPLHTELVDQQWPDNLTHAQCVHIVESFEFNKGAHERHLNLSACHMTEASLPLLAGIANGRGGLPNSSRQATRQRAWLKHISRRLALKIQIELRPARSLADCIV